MRYYSIRSQKDFDRLFLKGRVLKGAFTQIRFCDGKEGNKRSTGVGLAISVSRKVSSKAVDRNLWKRRIREVIRSSKAQPGEGTIFLINARPLPQIPKVSALREDIENLLKKVWN